MDDDTLLRITRGDKGLAALLREKRLADMPFTPDVTVPFSVARDARLTDKDEAYVERGAPYTARINPNLKEYTPYVLRHELEHVFQNSVDRRYEGGDYGNYDNMVLYELAKARKAYGATPETDIQKAVNDMRSLLKRVNDPAVLKRLHELGVENTNAYVGKGGTDQNKSSAYSLREQFADLRAMEEHYNKDFTRDPVLRKLIFNNDQSLVDIYNGTTGLRTDRLDARDPPPMTAQPATKNAVASVQKHEKSWLDSLKERLK